MGARRRGWLLILLLSTIKAHRSPNASAERLIDLMVTIGLIRPAKSRILAISTHPRHNSFVSHMQTIKKTYSPLVLPEHGRASAVDVRPSAVRRASGRLERRERRRFRRRRLLFGRDLRP